MTMFQRRFLPQLPLALSQTRFAQLAPNLPLSSAVHEAFSRDYDIPNQRDDALLVTSRSINELLYRQITQAAVTRPPGGDDGVFTSSGNSAKTTSEGVYNPSTLKVYDAFVWDFNAPFLWRISPDVIHDLYHQCLCPRNNHCEIGVGTGLFLNDWILKKNRVQIEQQEQQQQQSSPDLNWTLMDLNPNALAVCKERLERTAATGPRTDGETHTRLQVEVHVVDILQPPIQDHLVGSFDSVAANFFLHCLHDGDNVNHHRTAIVNIARLVHSDGVFFGSTILGKELLYEDEMTVALPAAVETCQRYNEWGIFGNQDDTLEGIHKALEESFDTVEIRQEGYCAVWTARRPKSVES